MLLTKMSAYPGTQQEPKKPSFLYRPVPMWAFLLLVMIIGIIILLPVFISLPPVTISQPLVLTPDSRTLNIGPSQTLTANFTVANLNTTDTVSATATATLAPENSNITLTISGVQTGTSFVAATNGNPVSFLPGGNTLVVTVSSSSKTVPGNYMILVSLVS